MTNLPGPFDDCDPHLLSTMSDAEFDRRMSDWRSRCKPWHPSEDWEFIKMVRGIGEHKKPVIIDHDPFYRNTVVSFRR